MTAVVNIHTDKCHHHTLVLLITDHTVMRSHLIPYLLLCFVAAEIRTISDEDVAENALLDDNVIENTLDYDGMMMDDEDRRRCLIRSGLKCGAEEVLEVGSVFQISSRKCSNGRYPRNEDCQWQFSVKNSCLPKVSCQTMDLVANWRRGYFSSLFCFEGKIKNIFNSDVKETG